MKTWEERVQEYENEGCTRSDAQGIVDAEDMKANKDLHNAFWGSSDIRHKC